MSDDSLIRKANLARLCKARGWSAADLHRADGGERHYSMYPAIMDVGSKKSFGERLARRLEESLKLPRGWLDQDSEPVPLTAAEPVPLYRATRWLFSPELFSAVEALSNDQRTRLENIMRAHLDMPAQPPVSQERAA